MDHVDGDNDNPSKQTSTQPEKKSEVQVTAVDEVLVQ